MIVVSDTTPLRYLAIIGGLEWIPALFGEVICPPEVLAECQHEHAPEPLRAWASTPPHWLRVVPVAAGARPLPVASALDSGEAAALCVARDLNADLVLLDERRGRMVAAQAGLAVTGTLGVLVEAASRGLIDFETALRELATHSNFRVSDAVVSAARARLAARRKPN